MVYPALKIKIFRKFQVIAILVRFDVIIKNFLEMCIKIYIVDVNIGKCVYSFYKL